MELTLREAEISSNFKYTPRVLDRSCSLYPTRGHLMCASNMETTDSPRSSRTLHENDLEKQSTVDSAPSMYALYSPSGYMTDPYQVLPLGSSSTGYELSQRSMAADQLIRASSNA